MHAKLTEGYKLLSNGGSNGLISKTKPKRMPIKEDYYRYPQIQLTLIDIKQMKGLFRSQDQYVQALKAGYYYYA